MVQSVAGGEGSVLSRDPGPLSDWLGHSWCCNCNIFPCSCYDINDSTFTLCRTRISHRLGPRRQHRSLLSFTKFGLYVRTGQARHQAGELSESRVWQAGKQLACSVSSLQSPHYTLPPSSHTNRQSRRLLSPKPHPGQWAVGLSSVVFCTLLCSVSARLTPPPRSSRDLSKRFKVYVRKHECNSGWPGNTRQAYKTDCIGTWNITVWFLDCQITPLHFTLYILHFTSLHLYNT